MKRLKLKTLLFIVVIVCSTNTDIFAQQRNSGWGRNSNYERLFNPKTVETLTGTVKSIDKILFDDKKSYSIHLEVKTMSETISIHLGPAWYIDNQETQFIKGDKITIKGSRIVYKKAPALIAINVIRDDLVLNLRDDNGYPVWRGWRRNGMANRGRSVK